MKGMSQYAAVATKIRGMRSHLLKNEDYAVIAGKESVPEIARWLKNHPAYEEPLEPLDPDDMRRETFERLLLHSILLDFGKISHFLNRKQKKFLDVFATHFDLRIINDIIREIFSPHSNPVDLSVYSTMYLKSNNFNIEKVISAHTIEELLGGLEGSVYHEPVYRTYTQLESPELFDYETALNRFYFAYFWQELNKFDTGFDKETLLEAHGFEIDMLNMLWIYRAKVYYKLSAQEIYRFIIPVYPKLKQRQISAFIAAGSTEELMKMYAATCYRKYINPEDPSSLERAYEDGIKHINDENRKKYPYSFAVIESYLYDKRLETDRIVKIAESVRYGYEPKLILNALGISR